MSNCPKCKQAPRNGEPMICDNDCGTILCEFCKREFFVDEIGKIRLGHAAWCGENSDSDCVSDDLSDESESESYDSYDSSDGNSAGDRDGDSRESEDSNGCDYSSSRGSETYSYVSETESETGDYSSDSGDYSE